MKFIPNSYQSDGSGETPEDSMRKYAKVVAYLVQRHALYQADVLLKSGSLLAPELAEFLTSLNGLVIINADEFTDNAENFTADKKNLPAWIINLLNVFSFFRFGTYVLPIKDGHPDWGNVENDVCRKASEKSPLFGRLPKSGEFSKMQIDLIVLLCHLPFKNGQIVISYTEGVPSSFHCKIKDNLWLETG